MISKIIPSVIIMMTISLVVCAQSIKPRPITPKPQSQLLSAPESFITELPINGDIEFQELEQQACDYYTGDFKVDNKFFRLRGDYKVWREKKFEELRIRDDVFSISAKLYYYINIHEPLDCQCGWNDKGPALSLTVGADTKLIWDDDYNITAHSILREIKHDEHCRVCYFDRDLTNEVDGIINSKAKEYLDIFDNLIATQNKQIRYRKDAFLNYMNADMAIDPGLTFKLNARILKPSGVNSTYDLSKNVQHLFTTIRLSCRPELIEKKLSVDRNVSAIDPDSSFNNIQKGFIVNFHRAVSYDTMAYAIQKNATVFIRGRRKAIIESAEVIPDSSLLGIKLKMRFMAHPKNSKIFSRVIYFFDKLFYKKQGVIYLYSSPSYNHDSNELYFSKVRYDIDTKKALARKANWLAEDSFCGKIASSFKYSDTTLINSLMSRLSTRFNNVNQYFSSSFKNQSFHLVSTTNAVKELVILYTLTADLNIN